MKLKFLLIGLFFSIISFAQNTAKVSGIITDKDSKQPVSFVSVSLKGTMINAESDINGNYEIAMKPGKYTIVFAFIGYKTFEKEITVAADETKTENVALQENSNTIEGVVIKGSTNKTKETVLLKEQQKAVEMKQSIGAQEMERKGISDVASAVTKTTGITKQEGSGNIYVRGLGDRYNSTTMNGLPLPSNNPSRKNIKLDIFNTDIVESIGVEKTYNFKNYGDFSGANIDIVSKNYKGKGLYEVGFDLGLNSLANQQSNFYLQDGPSKTGFSNINMPKDPFSSYSFSNKWNKETATPINSSYFLRGGKSFNVGDEGKLGIFASASFDNDFLYKSGVARGSVNIQTIPRKDLTFESYNYGTNTTLMGNLNYKINSKHSLQFNSMYINSTSQEHEEFKGIIDIFDNAAAGGGFVRRSNFDRTTLKINQLLGNHDFTKKFNINWGLSSNSINNVVPDRMQNTFVPKAGQSDLTLLQVADNNDSENHRYYQNLKDDENAANLLLNFKFSEDKENDNFKGKLTIGYSGRFKKVNFEATQFNFDINTSIPQPTIDINNIDGYFNQNSIDAGYFTIKTFNGGLKPQTFGGNQDIHAGYFGIEYKFLNKLTVIVGTRAESIVQNINWFTNINQGKKNFDKIEILPTTSIKYELTEKQNLKFAASKTYTLPQFKERAPFQFEDVTEVFVGNPNLYSSTDYNADIKWEYFPKSGELISFTAFGKYIQNPINEIAIASATNDISYVNTGEKAIALGGEFEIRKNIYERDNKYKESLNAGFNASYMYNNQDFNVDKVEKENDFTVFFAKKEGKLTGASDLLINADISYFRDFTKDANILATLTYNYFSDRIYAIGTGAIGKGDLIDKSIGTLDFILKSKLSKNIGIGLSAKNILNPTVERFQDEQDVIVESYKKGVNYKFSMTYSF